MLRGIHIPDEPQEADCLLFRYRKIIWKDFTRCKNRIKGLLVFGGIDIPEQYDNANWSHNFIKWLNQLNCKQPSRRSALNYMTTPTEFLRKELLIISNTIRKIYKCLLEPQLMFANI